MLCEPIGVKTSVTHIGAKPVYEKTTKARWRAMFIYIETGYSETPSWGHEAGGWIHYTYESMRDFDGNFIEAKTKADLLAKLKELPNIQEDNYFHTGKEAK
jgi:hypothetical protein